ncbi:MAG: hypothetical protein NZM04_03935, partial [Methylacidiphilales bacterium]|nr:hypothetical protein [Candidatus Methylacidiphilales bacterium]
MPKSKYLRSPADSSDNPDALTWRDAADSSIAQTTQPTAIAPPHTAKSTASVGLSEQEPPQLGETCFNR